MNTFISNHPIISAISGIIIVLLVVYFKFKRVNYKYDSLKFFHGNKLYEFKDATVLLSYSHGIDSAFETYLVKFLDNTYFSIEFSDSSDEADVKSCSKKKMIKELKDKVNLSPKEVHASLNLIQ